MGAIHNLVIAGDIDALKKLLQSKGDVIIANQMLVNEQDDQGNTPLMLAVQRNLWVAAELLLTVDADVSISNNHGETPLQVAEAEKLRQLNTLEEGSNQYKELYNCINMQTYSVNYIISLLQTAQSAPNHHRALVAEQQHTSVQDNVVVDGAYSIEYMQSQNGVGADTDQAQSAAQCIAPAALTQLDHQMNQVHQVRFLPDMPEGFGGAASLVGLIALVWFITDCWDDC